MPHPTLPTVTRVTRSAPLSLAAATLLAAVAVLMTACATPSEGAFELVRPGMSRDEVRAILGEPSGRFAVPVDDRPDGAVERWSYGDSLSSFATQGVFRDQNDPRVWTVLFDADGIVLDAVVPEPAQAERLRRLETMP